MEVTLETKSSEKNNSYTFQNESSLLHPSRYVSDFLENVTMCLADLPKQKHTSSLILPSWNPNVTYQK